MLDDQILSVRHKIFGAGAYYLTLIDLIAPIVSKHEYSFFSDDWFFKWIESEEFSIQQMNAITALELIEKAHLAAVSALFRAKRWADAICLMHHTENLIGWAASLRGFLESAGDTLDGLLTIPLTLAQNRYIIKQCLSGGETRFADFSPLEEKLDHFVHARWMRTKKGEENKLKAKDNVAYIGLLERTIPGAVNLYHRLCAISHPSNASIEYFYDPTQGSEERLKLTPTNDARAIASIQQEFPDALPVAMQMNCNPAFLILRVLHTFHRHPELPALKQVDWSEPLHCPLVVP
jgi:hypothetical protein